MLVIDDEESVRTILSRGLSGHDVLAELHKTDSSAKVIVCTGYAAARDQFAGVADVLQNRSGSPN